MDARTRPAPTSPDGPRGPGSTAGGHDRPAGWIDRYLAAATRWLPAAERDEVGADLRERLEDLADRHRAAGLDDTAAEEAAVCELGDPSRVAAQYRDRPLQLIGPDVFPAWWRMLWRLLVAVPVPVGAVVALATAAGGARVGTVVTTGLGTAWNVALQVAFWTTLAFALVEHGRGRARCEEWDPAGLPSLRRRDVALADTVATVAVTAVLAGLLVWQAVEQPISDGIALVDPALWSWWVPLVLAVLAVEAVVAVAAYRRGRWTVSLATVRTVLAVVFAVPTTWLLLDGALLDPALTSDLGWDAATIEVASRVVAAAVVLISLGEVVQTWWAVRRSR